VSVTEVKQALGTWSLSLRSETPREILDAIAASPFGHLAVLPGRIDPTAAGDGLLAAARYVGVYRHRKATEDGHELSGAGMAFWLGDEDGKGAVLTSAVASASASFSAAVTALIPTDRLTVGTLYAIPGSGTWTNTAQYVSNREALTYVTDSYGTDVVPVSWRVNGNGTVDAGRDVDLFVTTPRALLVRKDGPAGRELAVQGLAGTLETEQDVEDYTTKVVLLAEGDGASTVTASASTASPYLNLKGNPVVITRLISEFETSGGNATARAQLQLNRFTTPRKAVNLSTDEYDVKGTFSVGDTIMVYDPDTGFVDPSRETTWKGQPINPAALSVTELTWPVPSGWTVAFRTGAGTWLDLSKYYVAETGSTTVVVGGISRALLDSATQPVGSRPVGDASVPATPAFGTSTTASYQASGNGSGLTFSQVQLTWTQPLNVDGSTIVDGDRYEIRYRVTSSTITTSWDTATAPWGVTTFLITGLIPGTSYDFQIRAVDGANPANASAWSATTAVITSADALAPSTPAPPTVAASLIAVQVTHTLGKSSGGTYNLEADLDHFQVHSGASASFTPSNSTLLGKLNADIGNIRASIPAVGTYDISSTSAVWIKLVAVDTSGNVSGASTGASATATLIDTSHISDLTASKVTAGTMTATWIVGGTIATATSGSRVSMTSTGIRLYNSGGSITALLDAATGNAVLTGSYFSAFAGSGTPYCTIQDSGDRTTIYFVGASGLPNYAWINSPADGAGHPTLGVNSGDFTYTTAVLTARHRLWLCNSSGIFLQTTSGALDVGGKLFLTDTGSGITTYSEAGTGSKTGGQLLLNKDIAYLGREGSGVASGGQILATVGDVKMAVYNTGVKASEIALFDDETIWITGKFSTDNPIGGKSALYCGTWNPGAATSFTVSYGFTMSTRPQVVYSVHRTAAMFETLLTTFNTTSFTVTINSAAVAINLNYWAFRTG
jgi:fibronectin type III domain protein